VVPGREPGSKEETPRKFQRGFANDVGLGLCEAGRLNHQGNSYVLYGFDGEFSYKLLICNMDGAVELIFSKRAHTDLNNVYLSVMSRSSSLSLLEYLIFILSAFHMIPYLYGIRV
jgi:hypothetical protein